MVTGGDVRIDSRAVVLQGNDSSIDADGGRLELNANVLGSNGSAVHARPGTAVVMRPMSEGLMLGTGWTAKASPETMRGADCYSNEQCLTMASTGALKDAGFAFAREIRKRPGYSDFASPLTDDGTAMAMDGSIVDTSGSNTAGVRLLADLHESGTWLGLGLAGQGQDDSAGPENNSIPSVAPGGRWFSANSSLL